MNDTAISVKNIGKRYLLGVGGGQAYRMLRDVVANSLKNFLRKKTLNKDINELWALKNLSFDVKKGERIGIIGTNGAGKSTLLKLISNITEPTEGEIHLRGRVVSLLEVGSGMHAELTGKENIFMNAAIMGMSKAEVKRRLDRIVAFAEVEKFLDTPIKRYSTGMYLRLAFAVAAHLESEILIVDEILAVGDTAFQKKCLGMMEDVTQKGRTILMVSHNMPLILNHCQRAILLDKGSMITDGNPADVIQHYLSLARSGNGEKKWPELEKSPGNDVVRLRSVKIFQEDSHNPTNNIDISKEAIIEIAYQNLKEGCLLYAAIIITDRVGTVVFTSASHKSISSAYDGWYGRPQPIGLFKSACKIPGNFFNEGSYNITVIIGRAVSDIQIKEANVLVFEVHDNGEMRKEFYGGWLGVVRPRLEWNTQYLESALKKYEGAYDEE